MIDKRVFGYLMILLSGTVASQILPVAISPLLTRIYTPEELGEFSVFWAWASLLGLIVNARYDLAIVLSKDSTETGALLTLSVIVSIFFLVASASGVVGYSIFGELEFWVWLIPLSAFLLGGGNVLYGLCSRLDRFSSISKFLFLKSIFLCVIQISFGVMGLGEEGLIWGQILALLVPWIWLLPMLKVYGVFDVSALLNGASRYSEFPKYSFPAAIFNGAISNALLILFGMLYGVKETAFLFLAQKVIGLPLTMVSGAVSQIYYRECARIFLEFRRCDVLFLRFFLVLSVLAVLGGGVLYFISGFIFSIFFGSEWARVGLYVQCLMPFFMVRFVSSSLSHTCTVFSRQRQVLFLNFCAFLVVVGGYLICDNYGLNESEFVMVYSWGLFFVYFIFVFYCFVLSTGKLEKL